VIVTPPPSGKTQPEGLATLWYASYPASGSELMLHGISVDADGQQWGEKATEKAIDLGVSPAPVGLVGGFADLGNFSPAPDGKWVLESIGFRTPFLINMATGEVQEVKSYQRGGGAEVFTWFPDSKHFVALPQNIPGDVIAPSVDGTSEMVIPFPDDKTTTAADIKNMLADLAYSPDGKRLLDAVTLSPIYQVREVPQAQIGIRESEQGERKVVFELKQAEFVIGSLRWLTSDRVIFLANVYDTDKLPYGINNQETQLWQLDLSAGQAKMVTTLARQSQYDHLPVLLGTDKVLLITVEAMKDGRETANSLHLLNLDTGDIKTIVQLTDRRVFHPTPSPDGKWIAFVVNGDEYAEVWLATPDGQNQHAVAGPTSLNAPIFWTK
jgi:WD40 repeat protein